MVRIARIPAIHAFATVAAALVAMQVLVGRTLNPMWWARPTDVVNVLSAWFITGSIWPHIRVTITEVLAGFALGVALAVIAAVLFSLSATITEVLMPFIMAAYSLPKVALVPFFILTLGVGMGSKIAQVTLNVVFIVFLSVLGGLTSVKPGLLDSLRAMGAGRAEQFTKVKLPSALPWLFTGMRISARYALGGAIIVELLSSNRGLGFLAARSTARLNSAELFAAIFLLAVIGVSMISLLQWAENRAQRWKI